MAFLEWVPKFEKKMGLFFVLFLCAFLASRFAGLEQREGGLAVFLGLVPGFGFLFVFYYITFNNNI